MLFYNIIAQTCTNQNFLVKKWLLFFYLSFFPFSHCFAMTFYQVNFQFRSSPGKHQQDRKYLREFFSLKFVSIFIHTSGAFDPITVAWVSLETYFSSCITSVQVLPNLVKGDDVRSGTKANARHSQLQEETILPLQYV